MLCKTAGQTLAVLGTLALFNDAHPVGFHVSPLAIVVTLLLAFVLLVLGFDGPRK